ncbi:uncharacterized protein LOC118644403 [Monomorium pharaonis]|uniref:uncharacterized protein LOC118644403 n=1 Tax=Monomorium pharaonis TaxID=307658 RepID=UPI0017460E8E|nr:uncharacterized protein LOC118644403 [Monomorium pharaonis]
MDISGVISAIRQLKPDNPEEYASQLFNSSYRDKVWVQFLSHVLKTNRERTVEKHAKKIATFYKRHFVEKIASSLDTKTTTQSVSLTPSDEPIVDHYSEYANENFENQNSPQKLKSFSSSVNFLNTNFMEDNFGSKNSPDKSVSFISCENFSNKNCVENKQLLLSESHSEISKEHHPVMTPAPFTKCTDFVSNHSSSMPSPYDSKNPSGIDKTCISLAGSSPKQKLSDTILNDSVLAPNENFIFDDVFIRDELRKIGRWGHALETYPIVGKPFILPLTFWETYWSGEKRFKDKNWTDAFNKAFESSYKYCVLSIDRHTCAVQRDNKKCVIFHADGSCKNSSCTRFKFVVLWVPAMPLGDMTVQVLMTSDLCHISGEVHARFYKGQNRDELKKELKGDFPSVKRLNMLKDVSDDVLAAGNLNHVPSKPALNKMRSEMSTCNDLEKDEIQFMLKLIEKYKETWNGTIFNGYIQIYSVEPLYIILVCERVLRYLMTVRRPLFLYLDATGSIIKNLSHIVKQIYNYALVLPGSNMHSPLPIAEFISSCHGVKDITIFLNLVCHYLKLMTTIRPIVDKVETDFSLALLQSVSISFNGMKLSLYLQKMYDEVVNKIQQEPLTTLHICSSHFIKTVRKKIKTCIVDKKMGIVASNAITKLIHCTTVKESLMIFERLTRIFSTKNITDKADEDYLSYFLEDDTSEENDDVDIESRSDFDDMNVHGDTKKDSPFYKMFRRIYDTIVNSVEFCTTINKHYCEEFMNYVLDYLMPYYPLWSAIVIKKFGITRDSNACVENLWKIEKHFILGGKKRQIAPRYIQHKESLLEQRIRERTFNLQTSRQARNSIKKCAELDDGILAEEKWCKRRKGENIYFKKAKFIKNEEKLTPGPSSRMNSTEMTRKCNNKSIENLPQTCLNDPIDIDLIAFDTNKICDATFEVDPKNEKCTDNDVSDGKVVVNLFTDTHDYPNNFPNINISVGGITVNTLSANTLRENKWLDDNVVNAYLKIVTENSGKSIFAFDTFFVQTLMQREPLNTGYHMWLSKTDIWNNDIWLFPVFKSNHWTLLVVAHKLKLFIYYDSLQSVPPSNLLENTCMLMDMYGRPNLGRRKQGHSWHQWKLYIPRDIPTQFWYENDEYIVSGNCGIHILVWAYILCSGSTENFSEKDMTKIRKNIAQTIFHYPLKNEMEIKERNCKIINERKTTNLDNYKKLKLQVLYSIPIKAFNNTRELSAALHLLE